MLAVDIEVINKSKGRVVLVHGDTPASLTISGADVTDFPDDYVFAAGSVLITPSKNYVAFTDGIFTEKT